MYVPQHVAELGSRLAGENLERIRAEFVQAHDQGADDPVILLASVPGQPTAAPGIEVQERPDAVKALRRRGRSEAIAGADDPAKNWADCAAALERPESGARISVVVQVPEGVYVTAVGVAQS